MIVAADTSAIYAAFDAGQPEHDATRAIAEDEVLAISPLVLTDLDHLIARDIGFPAALAVQQALTARIVDGQYKLANLRPEDLGVAHEVRAKYEGLQLDLCDAVGVVLADRYRTNAIFTLDHRDYRAVTPLTRRFDAFRILPSDAS